MTQKDRIKELFESRVNEWIPLYEILKLHIAQYGARIKELRADGMKIENKWVIVHGEKHSWFRYNKQTIETNGQLLLIG
jgi:hypothetical protein